MVVRPKHVADNLNKIIKNYWNRVALDVNPWTWCNTRNGIQTAKFKTIILTGSQIYLLGQSTCRWKVIFLNVLKVQRDECCGSITYNNTRLLRTANRFADCNINRYICLLTVYTPLMHKKLWGARITTDKALLQTQGRTEFLPVNTPFKRTVAMCWRCIRNIFASTLCRRTGYHLLLPFYLQSKVFGRS
jgi:hypothetical protein